MDAIAHAATRRLDSSLHAVATPTPVIPVESVRTLSVTADYRLSEIGRKASLLNGGNGRAEQRVKVAVPLTRLHLVHVDLVLGAGDLGPHLVRVRGDVVVPRGMRGRATRRGDDEPFRTSRAW